MMTGHAYARHYAQAAARSGAEIRAAATVTGWAQDRVAILTTPDGVEPVAARAVLLATGCRERPRAARLVPGDRPPGVMTTGELQQRVYLARQRLPGRALVVGAEHVSYSAMVTRAPTSSRWSPSSRGSRATPPSRSVPHCAGGSRCGRRPRCDWCGAGTG
jgi:hypothetical protein